LWRTGHTIAEVPIIFTDRFIGTSKMSGKIVREANPLGIHRLVDGKAS